MARPKKKDDSLRLMQAVIEGIQQRKGQNVITMDFAGIHNAICRFFVICQGTSRTQVEAIADSVDEEVKKTLGMDPWHREGYENAEWILLDYVDVVVHIFQEKTRRFYRLEELWADANVISYASGE
jgi:ribosome-associated protein